MSRIKTYPRPDFPDTDTRAWLRDDERALWSAVTCGDLTYSADLPRFFAYAHKVATRYEGFGPLARLLEPLMGATRVDAFY